jgi:hypothetical protein
MPFKSCIASVDRLWSHILTVARDDGLGRYETKNVGSSSRLIILPGLPGLQRQHHSEPELPSSQRPTRSITLSIP